MRVSVDGERLEAIIKEKAECDCTYPDCPLPSDVCKGKDDFCKEKSVIIAWLDVKDLPEESHED